MGRVFSPIVLGGNALLYKCNYCDPIYTKEMRQRGQKQVKTIDTSNGDFIKDNKGKYYHQKCFRNHLRDKKMSEEEIEFEFNKQLTLTLGEVREAESKDKFLKWIMEFYDDSSLPSYFLKKLQNVRDGNYEGLSEPINYETLLDIYTYMDKYLRKLAAQKQIDKITQRMNYDLAVVIGNYGDYKKFKEKQRLNQTDNQVIEKETKVTDKVNEINVNNKHDKEFDITDIMDDLLL